MIIGLTGAAGSGKDSVADILVAKHGFQRIAFADCLYEEVSTAFNVPIDFLKNRDTKESPTLRLALGCCADEEFCRVVMRVCGVSRGAAWSPRQILQWWGTEYRRAQREPYWIDKVRDRILSNGSLGWVITDVRFQNEADLVQELGGQLGLVLRPGIEPVANHVSEEFWQTCSPDVVIQNDGTLEDLAGTVNVLATIVSNFACGNTKNGAAQ
ncbi:MAG: deoxynucleotide monophosphate kinase family protein [Acidithiobacillus sp.]